MFGCNVLNFFYDSPYGIQRQARKKITHHKEQAQPYEKQQEERFAQLNQVGVSITIVGGGSNDVWLSLEAIYHANALISALVKGYLLLTQNGPYHARCLFNNVTLYGIVVKHLELRSIYRHLYFVNKLTVIKVNRLHGSGISLPRQEQMRLGYSLTPQLPEESLATRLFTQEIDHGQAQQEYCCRYGSVF